MLEPELVTSEYGRQREIFLLPTAEPFLTAPEISRA